MSYDMVHLTYQIVALSLVLLGFDFTAPTTSRYYNYISPDGSDNSSGTLESPWRSLALSVKKMNPGDTLFVRGGIYRDQGILLDHQDGGIQGRYKTIKAFWGETPVFAGQGLLTNRASYVRFDGINYDLPYGLESSGDYVEVVNCNFSGSQPRFAAIEFSGNNGLIRGNRINVTDSDGRTTDHGIYLHAGANHLIQANNITGTTGYGIHVYDERKSWDPEGMVRIIENIVIDGNFIAHSKKRSGIIVSFGRSARAVEITIRRNTLIGNNHDGIIIRRGENIQIYNNTIVNNGCQGINLGDGDGDHLYSVVVANNIIVQEINNHCHEDCDWYPRSQIDAGPNTSLLHVTTNLYWPNQLLAGIQDPEGIVEDPQFKDAGQTDFELSGGSPAIDSGIFIGEPFAGSAPDLGAYEFMGKEASYAIDLKGFVVGGSVILSWQTKVPDNLQSCDVERSKDYVRFERIAEVQAKPSGSYQHVDNKLGFGRYYYRIKQRDSDGSVKFSSTIEIRIGR